MVEIIIAQWLMKVLKRITEVSTATLALVYYLVFSNKISFDSGMVALIITTLLVIFMVVLNLIVGVDRFRKTHDLGQKRAWLQFILFYGIGVLVFFAGIFIYVLKFWRYEIY